MTTKTHYEAHTADSYESAFFYQKGPYMEYLRDLCIQNLCLKKKTKGSPRILLDIGGGTGNFAKMLLSESQHDLHVKVVDPFLEAQAPEERLEFVKESAEVFMEPADDSSWREHGFDQVLLKEVVHHFQDSDRVAIFRGMREKIIDNSLALSGKKLPSLLIITRPQVDIDYPLWKEARDVWANNQPSADTFSNELKEAGFSEVQIKLEPYPCVIALDKWNSMVKRRFWSTFSNFSDTELEAACKTISESEKSRIDDEGNIHFEDRLLFIVATK